MPRTCHINTKKPRVRFYPQGSIVMTQPEPAPSTPCALHKHCMTSPTPPSDSEDFFQIDVDRKRVVETFSFLWDFFSNHVSLFFRPCLENEARYHPQCYPTFLLESFSFFCFLFCRGSRRFFGGWSLRDFSSRPLHPSSTNSHFPVNSDTETLAFLSNPSRGSRLGCRGTSPASQQRSSTRSKASGPPWRPSGSR